MRHLVVRTCALLCTVLGMVAVAAPAGASVGSGPGGFTVSVNVRVTSSGSHDPIPVGGISISVPAKCWWEPATNFDGTDAQAFWKYYKDSLPFLQGSETAPGYYSFPSGDVIKKYADLEKSGAADVTWWQLGSQTGVNCADEGFTSSRWSMPSNWGPPFGGTPVGVSYAVFAAGQAPPEPLVDVKDLSEELWDRASAQIAAPAMQRNPVITGIGGGTLVNLDTWFWVTNVADALADDGRIHIEATIPGTPVRTTLDAATDGVLVTSAAGQKRCEVAQATQRWTPQVADDAGCTVAFEKAKRSGWLVTTVVNWTGTWEGVDNNGTQSGTLAPLPRTSQLVVPVGESEALATDADGDGNH